MEIHKNYLDILSQEVPPDYYGQAIKNNMFQRYWHTRRFSEVRNMLKKVQTKRILDVGCHGGKFTNEIYSQFPNAKVYGIDIADKTIHYAQKTYPHIQFRVARAEKLPFKKQTFDLVACLEVLEHVNDPERVIHEISRVLKRNGLFIIIVPAENFLFQITWFFWSKLGPGRVWKHAHIQKFQKEDLDMLLKRNGFAIQKRKLFILNMLLLLQAKKVKQSQALAKEK